MKQLLVMLFLLLFVNKLYSQTRLVLNNEGYVVLRNNIYLIVDNINSNAIATVGTGGNIISENESNKVKWVVGANTGIYTIPFTKSAGNKIPLSISIATAGVGSGNIVFSTYAGSNWDNSTYLPSDVTSIGSITGGSNNSANVIDRFWIIDALGYTTKPSATINFTYLDAEWSAVGNSISEATLFAQRFNSTIHDWGGWLGNFGMANITTNTVSSGSVTPTNFYRSWTLVNQASILAIELLYFNIECNDKTQKRFEWATATEENNHFFTIEASTDALNWQALTQINGAGNSASKVVYSHTVDVANEYNYYRLKQTDFDGTYTYSDIVFKECGQTKDPEVSIYPNPNNGSFGLTLSNLDGKEISIEITNTLGQLIEKKIIKNTEDHLVEWLNLEGMVNEMYFITITTSTKKLTEKIAIYH